MCSRDGREPRMPSKFTCGNREGIEGYQGCYGARESPEKCIFPFQFSQRIQKCGHPYVTEVVLWRMGEEDEKLPS